MSQLSFDDCRALVWILSAGLLAACAGLALLWSHIARLKRAEAALLASEERLRMALAAGNQGYYDLDLLTGVALGSPEYFGMLGYSHADPRMTVADWEEKLHPDDREAARETLSECIAGQRAEYSIEYRCRARDGAWMWILSSGKVVGRDESGQPTRLLGIHTDITERKNREIALEHAQREADLFRLIVEMAPQGVGTADLAGNVTYQNSALLNLLGLKSLDQAKRHRFRDFYREDDLELLLNIAIPATLSEGAWSGELSVRSLDGRIRPTIHNVYLIRDAEGAPIGFANILTDIAERLRQEQDLRESEDRFRSVFEISSDGMVFVDPATRRHFNPNPAFCRLLGRPIEEIEGLAMDAVHPPEAMARVGEEFEEHVAGTRTASHDIPILRPDGEVCYADVTSAAVALKGGMYLVATFRDTTERRRQEEHTRRLLEILDTARDYIASADAEGNVFYINAGGRRMLGIPEGEELIGFGITDTHPPEWSEFIRKIAIPASLRAGYWEGESVFQRRDGTTVLTWQGIFPHVSPDGKIRRVSTIAHDIGDRKRIEDALRASEERLRQAVRASQIGIFDHDHRIGCVYWTPEQFYWSPELRKIHGFGPDEAVTLPAFVANAHPDDFERIGAAVRLAHDPSGDGLYDVEHRIVLPNGEVRWLATCFQAFFEGKGEARRVVRSVGTQRDITDGKRIEEELAKLAAVMDNSQDLIGMMGMDETPLYHNPAFRQSLGYQDASTMYQQGLEGIHPPEIVRLIRTVAAPEALREGIWRGESCLRHRDGHPIPVEQSIFPVKDKAGRVFAIATIMQDITERKRIEEDRQRLVAVLDNMRDFVGMNDMEGRAIYQNRAAYTMLGYDFSHDLGMTIDTAHLPEDANRVRNELVPLALRHGLWRGENRLLHRDGHLIPVEQSVFPVRDEKGRNLGVATIMQDIGERKRIEEEQRKLVAVMENSRDFIGMVDLEERNTYQNPAAASMLGYSQEELITLGFDALHPPEYAEMERRVAIPVSLEQGVWRGESRLKHRDGRLIPVEQSVFPVRDGAGQVFAFATIMQDITERKLAEERHRSLADILENSLNEVYVIDAETLRFLEMNRGARRNLGYEDEGFGSLNAMDIKPEFTSESYRELVRPLLAGERDKLEYHAIHLRKDGTRYPVEAHLQLSSFESRPAFVVIALDITERQRIELELRRMAAVVENTPDYIGMTDFQGNPLYHNPASCRMLGYDSPDELTFEAAHPPEAVELLKTVALPEATERGFWRGENLLRHRDGHLIPVQQSIMLVKDQAGRPYGWATIMQDITERKRIEEDLRRMAAVVENARDFVGISDLEGRSIYVNPAACAMLGYGLTERALVTPRVVHLPEDFERVSRVMTPLALEAGQSGFENRLLHREGHLIPVEQSLFPVRDEAGRIFGVATIMRDITERKRAEQALRESEERYREAQRTARLGHWSLDPSESRFLWWSEETFRLVGLDSELGSPSWEEFLAQVYPEDRVHIKDRLAITLTTGEPVIVTFRVPLDGGGTRILEARSVARRGPGGIVNRLSGTVMDITERERAEEALRASMEQLRTVITNAPVVLFALDREGVFTLSEGKGLEGMGLEPGEVVGASALDVFRGQPVMLDSIRRAIAGESFTATFEFRERVFEAHYNALRVGDKLGGTLGVLVDVTERAKAEEELRRLNEELESRVDDRTRELAASNRRIMQTLETLRYAQEELVRSEKLAGLGSLVAGVAHELNTPLGVSLTAISQFQEKTRNVLRAYEKEDLDQGVFEGYLANAAKTTDIILHNVERAAGLIRGFKQVAVDQASEALRSIDLKRYLLVVIESFGPELKKGGHRIEVDCAEGIEIETFPGLLAQILSNLIVNSVRHGFGPERAGGRIGIRASLKDGVVTLVYRDDGRGMSADVLNRAFEPFFTTARGQGGSGLGLSIVYNLVVHKLRGKLRCESAPGEGMAMTVEFPDRPVPEPRAV